MVVLCHRHCSHPDPAADATVARKYWNKLKQRLRNEGSELVTHCHQLKLKAEDGKQQVPHSIRALLRIEWDTAEVRSRSRRRLPHRRGSHQPQRIHIHHQIPPRHPRRIRVRQHPLQRRIQRLS